MGFGPVSLEARRSAREPGAASGSPVRASHTVTFEVRDRGTGFDLKDDNQGTGLVNMRDRIEAVGGRLSLTSVRDRGTVVRGSVAIP